jgi:hypothetical protein
MTSFYEVKNVPVHSCIMVATEREAHDFPTGDIELGFCGECGFVSNVAFDTTVQDYSAAYEDQQSFSPTFNSFARGLAKRLIEKYDIRHKNVVEIGCGKADFLVLMCEIGSNRGIGIDPTCIKERIEGDVLDRITIIQDYYSERYAHHRGDMILCRHTLEHIHSTKSFVQTIRNAIGERLDTVVFFEIPDGSTVLNNHVFWDIYYEHCSYFSPGSLARLFRACGFEVLDLYREYDDQYLLIDARPVAETSIETHPLEEDVGELEAAVKRFEEGVPGKIDQWKNDIRAWTAQDQRLAIWGSSSKCVSFLTTLGLADEIGCVVDVNPHRHGKFIPGVAMQVMPPDYLSQYDPQTIVVMNPVYRDEITEMVRNMQLDADVITV